jgi:hypothetical protein
MSEQEFQKLLTAFEWFNARHATPETARRALQEQGVLTETGELAEPYAPRKDTPA